MSDAVSQAQSLLEDHLDRHPLAEPADLYKLAHQACLGPGHLLDTATPRMVRDALAAELQALDVEPRDWEDAVDVLRPSTGMARVHLRPYVRSGGELKRLADALLATAEQLGEGDRDGLGAMLGAFRAGIAASDLAWPTADFDLLLREQIEKGLTVVSHSEAYRTAYDPHYRVVLLDTLSP